MKAMSAYLTAERVMRGSALPHLYVGLEYGSTGNHDQARVFQVEGFLFSRTISCKSKIAIRFRIL